MMPLTASSRGSRHTRRNRHRTIRFLEAGRDVQCVKLLLVTARAELDLGNDVESPGDRIDHGRRGDPNDRRQVSASEIGCRHRGNSMGWIDEAPVPERGARLIGVECIHAVVFRRDVHDVVRSTVRDRDAWHVKRLRVRGRVDRVGEQQAELRRVNRRRSQNAFREVLPGAEIIVAVKKRPAEARLQRSCSNARAGCAQLLWCRGRVANDSRT